jgi:hypothetical protein
MAGKSGYSSGGKSSGYSGAGAKNGGYLAKSPGNYPVASNMNSPMSSPMGSYMGGLMLMAMHIDKIIREYIENAMALNMNSSGGLSYGGIPSPMSAVSEYKGKSSGIESKFKSASGSGIEKRVSTEFAPKNSYTPQTSYASQKAA